MAEQQWYYRKGKGRFGPVDSAELKRLATSGELAPEDLLRGVGMDEWVKAEKVKGLFAPKTPSPPPVQKAARKPPQKPEVKQAPKRTAPPPVPSTSPPVRPTAPTAFDLQTGNDPFASFGLDASAPPDPFATAMPGAGLGSGVYNAAAFDNLAALEKQGQAIYRPPPPDAEPFEEKKAVVAPEEVGLSGGAKFGLTIVPYVFMILMTLFLASVYAISHHFVMGLMPMILAVLFSFVMTSGLTKAIGLFSGNCLEKLGIKNEVLALAYGGLLGLFGFYVLMGGYAWATLYFNPFQGQFDVVKAEMNDMEEAAARVEAQREAQRKAGGVVANEEEEEIAKFDPNAEEKPVELDLFGGDGDALDNLDKFHEERKKQNRREAFREAGFYGVNDKPIPLFEAYTPFWVYSVFMLLWWYWPIHGIILLLGTAHATWMSALGHDPTA